MADVRWSYDTVAEDYQRMIDGLMDRLPVERAVLRLFAELVGAGAAVLDVGCGTGEITGRLHEHGLEMRGLDVSPGMVQVAREHHPGLTFAVAAMHALPLASRSVDGVACWYVLQHVPDAGLDAAFRELRRVLRPSGIAMFAFHSGTGSHAKTEGYGGHPMRVQVHRRKAVDVGRRLERAGFTVSTEIETRPQPGAPSGGAYLIASPTSADTSAASRVS